MADWSKPTLTSTYTNFLTEVKDRDTDCATLFDGSTSTNLATNTKRWNATNNRFEKWTGSAWVDLTATYAISISGNAATATSATNISGVAAAANGGTGQSSYTVGDLLYASTTSALAKLTGVATGNALISGGVGVAPSWGKVGLTTHVSGTLPVANGGTGATASTGTGSAVLSDSPALTGTPTAPTAAADTNTTQLASTAYVLGQAASVAPLMNSTAAVGTSTRWARQDHVHPSDTTRAPLASPAFTGTPTAPTAASTTNNTQLATTAFVQGFSQQFAKAWVNFNGVTTTTIRASYNVSSVTRNSTGNYTINFTNAMSDANYALALTSSGDGVSAVVAYENNSGNNRSNATTTSVTIQTVGNTFTASDRAVVNVIAYR